MEANLTDEIYQIVEGLKAAVEYQAWLGVRGFPKCDRPIIVDSKAAPAQYCEPEDTDTAKLTLKKVREELGDCKRCKLHAGRTQIVFGDGNEHAELMFVGEAPGADEDRQGIPFVGKAGQLLTKIIIAMKFNRTDVYIANVNKCRPPDNRDPEPDEVEACEPFLLRQIQAIKPKVIVALGKWAAQTLLKSTTPISALRGNFQDYHGIKLMPTYHPAATFHNPKLKALIWEDVQKVMKEFGKDPKNEF